MDRDGEEGQMRGHAIRRGTTIVVGAVLTVGMMLAPGVARASGGGGCGRAVTYDGGTKINIHNYCFGPTILHVRPGETVTWVNRDTFPHSVLGANGSWGSFDSIRRRGRTLSYRFVEAGVYPYVCTIHVGMVGAVVVGYSKATGATQAVTTDAGPVTLVQPAIASSGAAVEQNVVPAERPARSWPTVVWLGMGVLLVVVAAIASSRRRRAQGTLTH
jgi:plastocyanin